MKERGAMSASGRWQLGISSARDQTETSHLKLVLIFDYLWKTPSFGHCVLVTVVHGQIAFGKKAIFFGRVGSALVSRVFKLHR